MTVQDQLNSVITNFNNLLKTIAENFNFLSTTKANNSEVVHIANSETISGSKTFTATTKMTNSNHAGALTIDRSATGAASSIKYTSQDTLLGTIGINSNKIPVFSSDNAVLTPIVHMDSTIADGSISRPVYIDAKGVPQVVKYYDLPQSIIDLTDTTIYDETTYYPVVGSQMPKRSMIRITLDVQLNAATSASWSNYSNGLFTSIIDLLVTPGYYGTTGAKEILLQHNYAWTKNNIIPAGYVQITQTSRPCFYLRGGGKYFLYANYNVTWTIYTEETTVGTTMKVAPTTTYPGITIIKSTIETNLVGNVTGNVTGSSGSCTGNAATATKATQDASGNVITTTYATQSTTGQLTNLETTDKTNLVAAINEVKNTASSGGSTKIIIRTW